MNRRWTTIVESFGKIVNTRDKSRLTFLDGPSSYVDTLFLLLRQRREYTWNTRQWKTDRTVPEHEERQGIEEILFYNRAQTNDRSYLMKSIRITWNVSSKLVINELKLKAEEMTRTRKFFDHDDPNECWRKRLINEHVQGSDRARRSFAIVVSIQIEEIGDDWMIGTEGKLTCHNEIFFTHRGWSNIRKREGHEEISIFIESTMINRMWGCQTSRGNFLVLVFNHCWSHLDWIVDAFTSFSALGWKFFLMRFFLREREMFKAIEWIWQRRSLFRSNVGRESLQKHPSINVGSMQISSAMLSLYFQRSSSWSH